MAPEIVVPKPGSFRLGAASVSERGGVHLLTLAATVKILLAAFALSLVFPSLLIAADPARPVNRENELKAAALYNIIGFTEWPATAFATPDTPLVIGVIGRGPVTPLLQSFIENESWHGRRLVLEHYASPSQAKNCHVLYVDQSEHARWPSLRRQFAGRAVLTVCDAPTFARQGGIVQLGIERNKLKLTVNLAAARAGELTISSKVLRLADVVGDPGP
jgi:hypothetical protein